MNQPLGFIPRSPTAGAIRRRQTLSPTFARVDTVEVVAGFPDTPSDPAVVVINPDDEITPESFAAWLDRRQAGEPVDPGVRAADTLAEARAAGEV